MSSLEQILPFQSIVLTVPRLRCEVINTCFIHGYETTQKLGFIAVKHLYCNILTTLLCSIVNKRGSQLAHSILMSKFSVNMQCKTLFEMPTMSASWRTFSRRSSNTTVVFLHHFWRCHLIWSTTAMFVLAIHTASFNLCHCFYCCK